MNNSANENNDANNYRINNNKTVTSKSFEYETKIIRRTLSDNNILDGKFIVPLKYLSNTWIFIDLLLIDCEIEVDLSWSRYCIISEITRRFTVAAIQMLIHLFPT